MHRPRRPRPPAPALRAALAAALVLAAGSCGDAGPPRKNVILISLDTTRADRLSCYGYERDTTPALRRFADESVVFEDCSSQSTATAPSHMTILTGHHVQRHGLFANGDISFPPQTLASILKDSGWQTAAFVGHGSVQAAFGHGVGFQIFESWKTAELRSKSFFSRNLPEVVPDALKWLDGHQKEPFFLFVHGYDPHCPLTPPEPFRSKFAGWYEGGLDLSNRCGYEGFQPLFEGDGPPEEDLRYLSDMYDAELGAADAVLGGFFDELRARGLFENTLVIFTSDHGEVLGAHQWVGHTRTWQPEIHVPLILRFPGGSPALRVPDPVMHVDLVSTVLSFLGLPIPEGQQGLDLMPLVRGEAMPEDLSKRMRLTQVADLKAVRFDDRWKIVLGEDRRKIYPDGALFDLVNDPGEETNLIDTPEGRERFEALKKRYLRWEKLSSVDDPSYRGFVPAPSEDPAAREALKEQLRALGYTGADVDDDR